MSSYGEGVLRRSVGRWRGVAVRAVTPSERRRQLASAGVLLVLDASVLEPDFHLFLAQP